MGRDALWPYELFMGGATLSQDHEVLCVDVEARRTTKVAVCAFRRG